jgi:hypothetical protein
VTVSAIYAVIARVVFMAELDRLLPLEILIGQIGRAGNLRVDEEGNAAEHDCNHKTRFGYIVRAAMK